MMMKTILMTVGLLGGAASASAQTFDYVDYVARVKAAVQAAGINLAHGPGECGRAEVTHRVAWALRGQGWGLLIKTGAQNGCGPDRQPFFSSNGEPKYGVDALVHGTSGECRDILAGGGDGNTPAWHLCDTPTLPISMYRPAYDPGPPYVPLNGGTVDPPPATGLETRVAALEADMVRVKDAIAVLAAKVNDFDGKIGDLYNRAFSDAERLTNLETKVTALEARPIWASCSVQLGLRCSLRQ